MSNAAANRPVPQPAFDLNTPIVDRATGNPSVAFARYMQQVRAYDLGANRIIPCTAAGTNAITLTPNAAHPLIAGYWNFDFFVFVGDVDSTGSVTARVVPDSGTLATLKVYKTNGAAQAGAGDIVGGSLYIAIYADHLDSGSGGLVLK